MGPNRNAIPGSEGPREESQVETAGSVLAECLLAAPAGDTSQS